MTFTEILEHNLLPIGDFSLNLAQIISATLIIFGAQLLMAFLSRTFFKRFFSKRKTDIGRQYAITTMFKYVLYTAAILWAMQAIGIQLSVLWGGAAALLVGIGLGLQQTFNDLISGVILLSEATVEVGDVVSVDGIVGTVTAIGMRTSKVDTRDAISLIIPNSKLVGDNVVNWSHTKTPTRFQVNAGVAYSSDVDLVTTLLLEAAKGHPAILETPSPKVQFIDFGNSSLDFQLHFFSHEYLRIENVKSDLRYKIMKLFREHHVEIPFPQRDLWLRNAEVLAGAQKGNGAEL